MATVERKIPFEGASNFRDLGGYPTADGGVTRHGLVYRADSLHRLSEADLLRYDALKIHTVYDLRSDGEREARPNVVESVATCLMSPVEKAGVDPMSRGIASDEHSGQQMLQRMYESIVRYSASVVGDIFRALAEGGVPAVFHCHAGKDRTGVLSALLLEALGVPRSVVLDDYELTGRHRPNEHQKGSFDSMVAGGMPAAAAVGILGAPRWAMAQTLDVIDAEFGGIELYTTGQCGLSDDDLTRLRRTLVAVA